MPLEIEAKFLEVNHDEIRRKLKSAGAVCEKPMRTMRRVLFDYPDQKLKQSHSRLRVRDEGDKITITYKSSSDNSNYAQEVEIIVDSFEGAIAMLEAIGLQKVSYQESKRETWELDGCEVVLDEWPWAKPYIEIEGPEEVSIKRVSKTLGFDWDRAAFGSADTVYQHQYPGMKADETINEVGDVKFNSPLPEWLKKREVA